MKIGITKFGEAAQWILTVVNTLHSYFDKLPTPAKERMPKWFGLTRDDEEIFAGFLGSLSLDDQKILNEFLYKKCKDYERRSFVFVVAGIPSSEELIEEKTSKDGSKVSKIKKVKQGREFLVNFIKFLDANGVDAGYKLCIGARIIFDNPLHQRMIKRWREGNAWIRANILDPLGIESIKDINVENCLKLVKKIDDKYGKMIFNAIDPHLETVREWNAMQQKGNWFQQHFCPWRLFRKPIILGSIRQPEEKEEFFIDIDIDHRNNFIDI